MRTVLVRVVLFCGITFVSSILLAAPYLVEPSTGKGDPGLRECLLSLDADVARTSHARLPGTY
jgi:hypothetical protein